MSFDAITYALIGACGSAGKRLHNARNSGALGDGVTDDAPAINALIQRLSDEGGGTIYLPAGTYMLDSSLLWESNISLLGDGIGRTILKPRKVDADADNFSAIVNKSHTYSDPVVNCTFREFTIDGEEHVVGTYDSSAKGIFILYMKDCTFEDLCINNTGATGLGIDFLQNVTISRVRCYNCGRAYVVTTNEYVVGGAGIGVATMGMPVESCVISDCITEGCGNYGIFVECTNQTRLYVDDDGNMATDAQYTIANCQCLNGRNYGIVVKGTHGVVVANNICRGNARDGLAVLVRTGAHSKDVVFSGNISVENGGNGFRIDDSTNNSRDIKITGNYAARNEGSGFKIYGDSTVKNLQINDNIFADNGECGVYIYDSNGLTDAVISGNLVSGNASDGLLLSGDMPSLSVIGNTLRDQTGRGIAIGAREFTAAGFRGNVVIGNEGGDWVVKGYFSGIKPGDQVVQVVYPTEETWVSGLLDDSGELSASETSFVTESYYYCGGANYAGFELEAAAAGAEKRIVACSFYDAAHTHISRAYNANAADAGIYRFSVPTGAAYVRFRMGYNTSITSEYAVLSEGRLLIYATDRT